MSGMAGGGIGCSPAGAILTIDLEAVAANYRALRGRLGRAACGAVVKADAYGLGVAHVAPVLFAAGCRNFFVAHLDEGIALRLHLPREAIIYVLHGLLPASEAECLAHGLVPVLNSVGQVGAWGALARGRGRRLPAALQVDSGMARLGLAPDEVTGRLREDLGAVDLLCVMSHLACADTPDHPANEQQRLAFDALRPCLPAAPASLAASSGIFLSADYHYHLARPGAALYGVAPVRDRPNPMRPVVRLEARIIQLRDVPPGTPVGYGHVARTTRPTRLATIAAGYADGFPRSGGGRGAAHFAGVPLPLVGRISMDSIVLDVSTVPRDRLAEGSFVELIGPHRDVDAVAADAGTIGYEVLTSLGHRYQRRYRAAGEPSP